MCCWKTESYMHKNPKKELIRAHYEHRVIPGRDSFDILDWGSREAQWARFQVLVDVLLRRGLLNRDEPLQLLDVGCGLSDLCTFLGDLKLEVQYTGVDIVPGIVAEARRRHPDRDLLLADIFEREPFPKRSFDVAFCSGTFNLEMGNNDEFALAALATLAPLVRECLVANFLHCRAQDKYDHCHYYDPERMAAAIAGGGRIVEIRDDYLENDFTLTVCPGL